MAYFRQTDPRWVNQKLGSSGLTMASQGCVTSCAARIASQVLKRDITPGEMNNYANKTNGYTTGGLFIWKCLENFVAYFKGKIKYLGSSWFYRPLARYIIRVVLIKTKGGSVYRHYVCVQPKGMCYDPLTGTSHSINRGWTLTNEYRYFC